MQFSIKPIMLAAIALVAAGGLGYSVVSFGNAGSEPTALDKEAMKEMVREILLENPDMVVDALDAYSARQAEFETLAAQQNIQLNLAALKSADDGFAYGATDKNRKVVVVEMFDYHCGFCKKATDYVRNLPIDNPDVQVIFRELPILRDESDYAAEAALASRAQGKYVDFHMAMMNSTGVLTAERVDDFAQKSGIDIAKLRTAAASLEVSQAMSDTRKLAIDLGVSGTPTFIVLSEDGSYSKVIGGFDVEEIEAAIAEARKAG